MLSVLPYAGIVVMSMLDKDKEFAERIVDINQQVQTGDANFEQAIKSAYLHRILTHALCYQATNLPDLPGSTIAANPVSNLNAI
jgi:hypothetical protein